MEEQPDIQGEVDLNPTLLLERLDNMLDGFIKLIPALVIGFVVLVVFFIIGYIVRNIIRRSTENRSKANLGMVVGRLVQWVVILLGFLIAAAVVVPSVTPGKLLGALGFGGVAIGFAFKDILQNFLSGILLLVREPFKVGDQIIYKEFEGTVTTVETRATYIKTYDGRAVIIPNGEIYTSAVTVNTAENHLRSEYDIGIGYGDDIDKAQKVILKAMQDTDGVVTDPAPDIIVVELADSTVNIRARWWTDSRRADIISIKSNVLKNSKYALDEAGIDMPYPTTVNLWHDQTEETDGDRTKQREGWPAGENPPKPARKINSREIPDDK